MLLLHRRRTGAARGQTRSEGRRQRGQSLVELAIILPVFLVLLAAALDLGRIFYATISLNNAAREGAFQAAEDPTSYAASQPCDTTTNLVVCRVQLEAKGSGVTIPDAAITMTCATSGCPAQANSTVTVNVTGTFTLVTPLLSAIFGGQTVPLSSKATAQIQYLPSIALASPVPPTVAFTATNVTGPAPLLVSFTDGSAGSPIAWVWDFGDGSPASNQQNPQHQYTSAGSYDVTLTIVNSIDSASLTKVGYIVVDPASPTPTPTGTSTPTPSPSPSPTPTCIHPPNVIGLSPGAADLAFGAAGYTDVTGFGDLSSGPKGKVQAQNPDATSVVCLTDPITYHYRPS